MNRRPFRIWLKRFKALWIALAAVNIVVVESMLLRLDNDWALGLITSALQIAWIYYLTRAFRGLPEDPMSARPWWRMTARPKAGFVLGVLFAVEASLRLVDLVGGSSLAIDLPGFVSNGAIAALYLSSSTRLVARPAVATQARAT